MPGTVLRYCALLICGWVAAAGVVGAQVPWDANRLPEGATEARILALKPTSPFARFRDALDRTESPDPEEFRIAARGILRWGRNQPGTLLDLGRLAMKKDPELAGQLLREYELRTPHSAGAGAAAWAEAAPKDSDPVRVFHGLPARLSTAVAVQLAKTHPAAAWTLLLPYVRDPAGDPRYAALVLDLARKHALREDASPLARWALREDISPGVRRGLSEVVGNLRGVR